MVDCEVKSVGLHNTFNKKSQFFSHESSNVTYEVFIKLSPLVIGFYKLNSTVVSCFFHETFVHLSAMFDTSLSIKCGMHCCFFLETRLLEQIDAILIFLDKTNGILLKF